METKNITTYKSESFGQIRTATDQNGNPIFCLSDVCHALEINNPRQAAKRLCKKGVIIADTLTNRGTQKVNFINEPNLYRLIFQSRKATAEQFQNWVFEEVLPSIRKTGGYKYEAKVKELEQENTDLRSKLSLIEKRITNHKHNGHLTSTTKLAKMLGFSEVGELIEKLDDKNFIIYFANMMILTPLSESNEYAEYVTWWKGNRKIEYVGWTDKGISAIVQELNISNPE